MEKDILFFGIQGSGKGTQAKLLAEREGMIIFETGAELRKVRKEESELGNIVREIIDRGDLVPNEIVMDIVRHFLENTPENARIIFDGIPRSMPQKETFDALLAKKGRQALCLFLDVPEEEVVIRMRERGREDDTEVVIRKRIENYKNETIPVLRAYEKEGSFVAINGNQLLEAVAEDIQKALM